MSKKKHWVGGCWSGKRLGPKLIRELRCFGCRFLVRLHNFGSTAWFYCQAKCCSDNNSETLASMIRGYGDGYKSGRYIGSSDKHGWGKHVQVPRWCPYRRKDKRKP